jgi:hypothetical protein
MLPPPRPRVCEVADGALIGCSLWKTLLGLTKKIPRHWRQIKITKQKSPAMASPFLVRLIHSFCFQQTFILILLILILQRPGDALDSPLWKVPDKALTLALSLFLARLSLSRSLPSLSHLRIRSLGGVGLSCSFLYQYLLQSCARGERRIVEDMCRILRNMQQL